MARSTLISTKVLASGSVGSFSISAPAGAPSTDLLVLVVVGTNNGTPGFSAPAGWTTRSHVTFACTEDDLGRMHCEEFGAYSAAGNVAAGTFTGSIEYALLLQYRYLSLSMAQSVGPTDLDTAFDLAIGAQPGGAGSDSDAIVIYAQGNAVPVLAGSLPYGPDFSATNLTVARTTYANAGGNSAFTGTPDPPRGSWIMFSPLFLATDGTVSPFPPPPPPPPVAYSMDAVPVGGRISPLSSAEFDYWAPDGTPVVHATGNDLAVDFTLWTPDKVLDPEALAGLPASYLVSGFPALLTPHRHPMFVAGNGTYFWSGYPATIIKGILRSMSAMAGSYALSGDAASFLPISRIVAALSGLYAVTGNSAGFVLHSGGVNKYVMPGTPGTYSVAGAISILRTTLHNLVESPKFAGVGILESPAVELALLVATGLVLCGVQPEAAILAAVGYVLGFDDQSFSCGTVRDLDSVVDWIH